MGVPSVISNFGSSREVVIEGKNGIICNIDEMTGVIYELMKDESRYVALKTNCESLPSENDKISVQLLELFSN